jgi:hypothetical protein
MRLAGLARGSELKDLVVIHHTGRCSLMMNLHS